MGKRQKIILISILSIVVLVIIGIVITKSILTTKIEDLLANDLPSNMKLEYADLDLSILSGSLSLTKPKLTVYGKTTKSVILHNEMSSVSIDNVGYWNYLVHDKIEIENIQINHPKVNFVYNELVDKDEVESSNEISSDQIVNVKSFKIVDGNFSIHEYETDSSLLKVNKLNFILNEIVFDKKTSKQKIPFNYSGYNMSFKDLFYRMNDYENLKVGKADMSSESLKLKNFQLYTKYSKQELSRIISTERDHMDLKVDDISISNPGFGYQRDSVFYFESPKVVFENPKFNIYRDKLKDDDTTIKSMYSKMLRDLKFDLSLSKVLLNNATINYSEKVKPDSGAGEISFSQLNANIKNLSNTYASPEKTDIDIDAIFMKTTPIKVNWVFDVNNTNDHFSFKADIGKLPAPDLNQFSEPNLKVLLEGELQKTYFTIDGNVNESSVNLRANYDDFKVTVLDKEGERKNKFLSTVVNLFIKKDSNNEEDNYREGSKSGIERDKTKSIFNFLWLNSKSGLLSALTGNGKK